MRRVVLACWKINEAPHTPLGKRVTDFIALGSVPLISLSVKKNGKEE